MMRIIKMHGRRTTAIPTSLLVVMCFIAGATALGDETRSVPARAVELSGAVKVNYAGKAHWQELFRVEGVRDGDRVFTGPDGEVTLKCKDKTLITLSPRSGMEIERLSVEVRGGGETTVTALILTQGRAEITAGTSGRYRSDLTLAASDVRLESSGDGGGFNAVVEYVPDTETIDIVWRGGKGVVTVPVEHAGVVEVTFGADVGGGVSFSRAESPDSGDDTLTLSISGNQMNAPIDAVIDRIVIRGGGRATLSGRTAGSSISMFTDGEERTSLDAEEGFWTAELTVGGGDSFSPEPTVVGASGNMPELPAEEKGVEGPRGSEGRPDLTAGGEPRPEVEKRDVSRIARSFLDDFIDAVEEGDTTTISGLIDLSYSGIGGSRYGLVDLVREYFETADILRITWSTVSISETEDGIIVTISWSSSTGTSGATTFWLINIDNRPSLSHADGDWFF